MSKNSRQEIEVLRETLQDMFTVFASRISGLTFQFKPEPRVSKYLQGHVIVATAAVSVGRYKTSLDVEQNNRTRDFRVNIRPYEDLPHVHYSHVLLVKRQDVGNPGNWGLDTEKMGMGSRGEAFLRKQKATLGSVEFQKLATNGSHALVYDLVYDALNFMITESVSQTMSAEFARSVATSTRATTPEPVATPIQKTAEKPAALQKPEIQAVAAAPPSPQPEAKTVAVVPVPAENMLLSRTMLATALESITKPAKELDGPLFAPASNPGARIVRVSPNYSLDDIAEFVMGGSSLLTDNHELRDDRVVQVGDIVAYCFHDDPKRTEHLVHITNDPGSLRRHVINHRTDLARALLDGLAVGDEGVTDGRAFTVKAIVPADPIVQPAQSAGVRSRKPV